MDARHSHVTDGSKLFLYAAALILAVGCKPKPAEPTAEQLNSDHALTREVMRQCKDHPGSFSVETCIAASNANRTWFKGGEKARYTPNEVDSLAQK